MTHLAHRSALAGVAARAAGVFLLTPLIVSAAVIAVVAVPAVFVAGRLRAELIARRRPVLAPVAQLNASHAEPGVEIAGQRAA